MKHIDDVWHNLSIKQITDRLDVDVDLGVSESNIKERILKYGVNELVQEKKTTDLKIFISQFKSPLIYILVIAFIVTIILEEYIDSLVIFFSIFLNTLLGFFQERKASNVLSLLRKAANPVTIVLRDGVPREVNASEAVIGDIVLLKEGDRVPADVRLIDVDNLKINEAVLTGELLPIEKSVKAVRESAPIFERKNMAFLGSAVVEGRAKGIVVAIGEKTEFGKISHRLSEIVEEETPLQKRIKKFSYSLAIFVGVIILSIFFIGILLGEDVFNMFLISVALAVAAIPEGLPIGISIALAIGMQRILRKNGLVRKLNSVDTLGNASVICMDKTGTLTEGQMQVSRILTGTSDLLGDESEFKKIKNDSAESHVLALKIGALVSDVLVERSKNDEVEKYVLHGDPLEQAIVSASLHIGFSKADLEKKQPKLKYFPFSPLKKYSASLHEYSEDESILYLVGAPENLLDISSEIEVDGHREPMEIRWKMDINKKFNELTGRGLRVVAVGYKTFKKVADPDIFNIELEANNIVFVGFIGLADPLRPEAAKTVSIAKKAGIRPILITGDNRMTAEFVAREAGFVFDRASVLEGRDLDKMTDFQLEKIVDKAVIYARAIPEHKLRIIKALQSKGEVVAMIGDGVNDSPALKKADIGVALGSGTEVAKQASDLVLLTNSFGSIVYAIRQGRVIFDNVKKIIIFVLKDAFTEVNLIVLSLIAGFPLPLLPAQILWVNLFQDSLPALAFAMEPGEEDVMNEKPKSKNVSILDREMKVLIFIYGISSDILLFIIFVLFYETNGGIEHTRTLVFMLLAMESLFSVFSLKSLRKSIFNINIFSNKYLIWSVVAGLILMVTAVYLEPLQKILKTVPLNLSDWIIVVGFAIFNVVFIEVVKLILRKGNKI